MKKNKLLSIVVPVFNEEENIETFYSRLHPIMSTLEIEHEIDCELIFTDNCSQDKTFDILSNLVENDDRIHVFRFSRNFGFQRSIITGYSKAHGDAVLQIDCDLEDPPELIIAFVKKWKEGFQVVYGVRHKRQESKFLTAVRSFFYAAIDYLSDYHVPRHAGDFRLIDRRVVDIVCQINDARPYLRGLIASLGFQECGIPYNRDSRYAGKSKFNFGSYFSMSMDALLQASVKPLYISLFIGMLGLITGLIMAGYYIVSSILHGREVPGFLTIALLQIATLGAMLFFLGLLGLYVGRIYLQVLRRPHSVVEVSIENHNGTLLIQKTPENSVFWPSTTTKQ